MACLNTGLEIIEVSDPKKPELVGNISTGGLAVGVTTHELRGKIYAFVACDDVGLKIIEVSDP